MRDINKLGTYHISDDLQNYETARSNFFQLIVEDLDDLLYPEFSYGEEHGANHYITGTKTNRTNPDSKNGAVTSGQEILKLSVNKTFVPHFSLGVIEVQRGNSVVKFAGKPTWEGNKTIEFQDFVGLETKNVLMAWQALAYDVNTDTQGRAGDYTLNGVKRKGYKKNCTLVEYTPDFQVIRYWDIIGCWISSLSESDFEVGSGGEGGRQISATFEFDRAIMHMADDKWDEES